MVFIVVQELKHHEMNSRSSWNKFCFLVPLFEPSQGYSGLVQSNLAGTHLLLKLSWKGENSLDGKGLLD